MFHLITIILIVVTLFIYLFKRKRPTKYGEYKIVPTVAYNWPIVGHGIPFGKDIMGFIKKCRAEYGDIFHIKVFRKNICIICDKSMVREFFKKKEHEMSMYENLKSIYFDYAFSDNGDKLIQIIDIMNATIKIKFDEFLPKIIEEANAMAHGLSGTKKLTPLTIGFVSRTSARCFLGLSLTDEMYVALNKFTDYLNMVTSLTYFFPKWLIRQTIGRKLVRYRKEFGQLIKPYIGEYRSDLDKKESLVFRHCVDQNLSDDDICDSIVCLLYVSSENTALGLNATLIDLIKNPIFLERLRAEIFLNKKSGQINPEMIKGPYNLMWSCVLESARLNSHVFAITRNTLKDSVIGEYYVGNIDHVVLCEPILMKDESASITFENPSQYNPDRYNTNKNLMRPENIITWGSGKHLCPGKNFAIYEIATATSTILSEYDIYAKSIPPLNYFSPSAYGDMTDMEISLEKTIFVENDVIVQKVGNGFLLRNYLTEEQQIELYDHILDTSADSKERVEIQNARTDRAFPILMWNNVYTGESNCMEPKMLIDLGNKIINKFPSYINSKNIDSAYVHLFGPDASMSAHYDEHVDYGISINLGASVLFTFGKNQLGDTRYVVINSGDIFVADFSTNLHSIENVLPNTPDWFRDKTNYGRTRCGIQLRDLSRVNNKKISDEEFKTMLKSY